jgi:hypothetical protein
MTLESGYLNGQLGDGGYSAVHRGLPRYVGQRITPNFEKKEGERFGPFVPAPYLPSVRLEVLNYDHFVIGAGRPVALDSRGYAVPAGLKKALALGAGNGPKYKEADVLAGVRNAAGDLVVVDEYVVDSMIDESITIGSVIGVASYDVYMQLNSDPHNPATYRENNYNRQNSFAILTNYLLEFPTVGVSGAKFPGMAVWKGAAKAGDLVTFDIDSNFVKYVAPVVDDSTLASVKASVEAGFKAEHDILGVVTAIESQWPKQLLDQVKTAFDSRLYSPTVSPDTGEFTDGSGLDAMPGSATDGVPHAVQYAGGNLNTAVVTFKLKL